MDIYFKFKSGSNRSVHSFKGRRLSFKGGIYKTSDKEEVTDIISSDLYRRGEVEMLGDVDVINDYLSGDEPDYLTKEILNTLHDDCIKEIGLQVGTKEKKAVMIIRAELVGIPISNEIKSIMSEYEINNEPVVDFIEKGKEDGLLTMDSKGRWYKFDQERLPNTKATLYREEAEQILHNYYKGK